MQDLSHIDKQIQKNTVDIEAARHQAENHRMMADQKREEGSDGSAQYYEEEALRFEAQATELEGQIEQLTAEKTRVETRINELEGQRQDAVRNHTEKLSQIDHELANLRGSSFML